MNEIAVGVGMYPQLTSFKHTLLLRYSLMILIINKLKTKDLLQGSNTSYRLEATPMPETARKARQGRLESSDSLPSCLSHVSQC